MSWQPPQNYEPLPNIHSVLRNITTPEVGTALFKMVTLVASGASIGDLGLTKRQARKAITDRLVPEEHYDAVLRVALDRPPGSHGADTAEMTNDFRFLIEGLEPWAPGGRSDQEKLDAIADLAATAFEPADSLDDTVFDNPQIPAGYTYLGQFIDHDITADPRSLRDRGPGAGPLPMSVRTNALELDSAYGDKPGQGPMFESDGRFRIGRGFGDGEIDLPREDESNAASTFNPSREIQENKAVIGDVRNDENILVSHVHLSFLKFHNSKMDGGATFREARRETILHYQWIVLHDFLKRTCGTELVESLIRDPDQRITPFPQSGQVFMPVEFAMAAYRFGHSMVRPRYALNDPLTDAAGEIPIFQERSEKPGPLAGLRGGRRLPPMWQLQMDRFFPIGNGAARPQRSRRIDTKLAPPLVELPEFMGLDNPRLRSLPFRNLRRGWENGLPDGQTLAAHLGLPVLKRGASTPLWLYILQEAESESGGRQLGTLGAHLVVETFLGLIENSQISVIREEWTPTGGAFEMSDLLREAGMPLREVDLPFGSGAH